MKRVISFLAFILICSSLFSGCFFAGKAYINDWAFMPTKLSGSVLNLSLLSGSDLEFEFNIENNHGARSLQVSTFSVVFVVDGQDNYPLSIYFDDHETQVDFTKNETKRVVVHTISAVSLQDKSKIIIKYDGTLICQYNVSSN